MGGAFKFFVNALKAIFFSPFYLAYFACVLVISFVNYIIGEIRVVCSGFKYGSIKENIYEKKLQKYKAKKGVQQ